MQMLALSIKNLKLILRIYPHKILRKINSSWIF